MTFVSRWQAGDRPTLSFELFPARSEKAAVSLEKTIDDLAALTPDFVSVTFGAGGSTREGSRQLIATLRQEKGLDVIAYFACYGLGPEDIVAVLDSYRALGVTHILAVRGDAPHDPIEPHPNALPHASDLVAFIRAHYGDAFTIGVAGYPEGHIDAASKARDLDYLKLKVDQGADFIITNYCYDNRFFFDYVARARAAGISVPILPGVMPIYSVKMMETLAGLCGATITPPIRDGIAALAPDDKAGLQAFGIDFAVQQCTELLQGGVPGLHIYTMDRSASAVPLVTRLREAGVLPSPKA